MKGNCSKRTTGPKHQNKLFIGTTTFDKVSNIDKFLRNIVVNSLSGDDSKIFFAHASSREENPSIHFHRKEDEKTSSILTVILLLLYIIFKQTPGLFAISPPFIAIFPFLCKYLSENSGARYMGIFVLG